MFLIWRHVIISGKYNYSTRLVSVSNQLLIIVFFSNYFLCYRDLSKPIAIQNKDKEEKYLQNYRMLLEASEESYHYASLYSNSGTVLHYLVRLPPFTKMFLDYQGK